MQLRLLFHSPKTRFWPLLLGILLPVLFLLFPQGNVAADVTTVKGAPSDDFCLACHQQAGLQVPFENKSVQATVNPTEFGLSVHAQEHVGCVNCHPDISDYPHPTIKEKDSRDFSLAMLSVCQKCHTEQAQKVQDSVHQQAAAEGNKNAAVCTDCHNPHTQKRLTGKTSGELTNAARLNIPLVCAQCHGDVYDTYRQSVHGAALTDEGNKDVPTCIDCHGVHNIADPTTTTFRNSTPYLCAKCHTNKDIMDKYGISTNVLDTYVADFHGTTVKLFAENYPDQPTNKAVCTDCHGFHNISKVNQASGVALRENLLVKCQRCHPDATANFPDAWMHHYTASPEHYPIVYYVNLFYKFLIPIVLGGMGFFILTDIYRTIVNRRKGVGTK